MGAIMLEKPAFGRVRDLLDATDFNEEAHSVVYKACITLFNNSQPIDLLTVTDQLRKDNNLERAGGPYMVTSLTDKVSSADNLEAHASIIKELSLKRKLIKLTLKFNTEAYDDVEDIFDTLEKIQKELSDLTKLTGASTDVPLADQLHDTVKDIERVMKGGKPQNGLQTGFYNLDKVLGVWVKATLIILAARPAMGKSALALRFVVEQVDTFNVPAALFSLEMSNPELINRLLSMETRIFLGNIRFRKIDEHQLPHIMTKAGKISDYPLFLIDKSFSLQQIRSKARRLVEEEGVKFIVIDYLQLIVAGQIEARKNSTRESEIAYISRELKMLAKELNIPIMALSQLSRALEHRGGDKRPKLSDLRESGAIEQDADVVMFLYRPEYYNIKEDYDGKALSSGYTEVIIAKNRNGPLEMAELTFHPHCTDFSNYNPFDSRTTETS